jgi:hypothetical protein
MRSLPCLCAVFLIAGCASGSPSIGASSVSPEHRDIPVETNPGNIVTTTVSITKGATATTETVAVPVDELWAAVLQAYPALGLQPETIVSSSKYVSTKYMRVREIGGQRISKFFDCGVTYSNGGVDVYALARTQLVPAGDGVTTIRTEADAYGRSPSRSKIGCTSTGVLESMISQAIHARTKDAHS